MNDDYRTAETKAIKIGFARGRTNDDKTVEMPTVAMGVVKPRWERIVDQWNHLLRAEHDCFECGPRCPFPHVSEA